MRGCGGVADLALPVSEAPRRGADRYRRGLWPFLALLVGIAAVDLRWVWLYRHGQPYDIDENGYLSIALANHRGLLADGLRGWWRSVIGPSIQAPLMTASTTPAFLVGGPNPVVGLLVPIAFGLVTLAATFLLGRRVGGHMVGWWAGLLALGAPMLLNYSRSYNFAIAATAMLTLALLALARSSNLEHRGWSALLGLFLGLTALSRTMVLAFLPGIMAAMALAVAVGPARARRAVNGALGVAAAVAVAFPWYRVNWSLVYDYLTSFGYGSRAAEYGIAAPFFSFTAWRVTLQSLAISVFLPYLLLLGVGGAVLVAVAGSEARRRGLRLVTLAAARSPLMPCVLVVIEGLAALTSSQNKGSGFVAPLIPAMAVCLGWAAARLPVRPRRLLGAAAAATVVLNVLAAADLGTTLARPRLLTLPVLGLIPVTDGRGTLQQYEAAEGIYTNPSAQPLSRRQGAAWVAANADAAARVRASGGPRVVTAFGFRHRLLNVNSVQIEELSVGAPPLPLAQVAPLVTTDTVDGYARWLSGGDASRACNLLTAAGDAYEFPPAVTTPSIEQAAQQEGFVRFTQWPLPDGRLVTLWRRATFCL